MASDIQPSCWMAQLRHSSPDACRLQLRQLAIPGTHDSGTWALTSRSSLYLENSRSALAATLKRLASVPGIGGGLKATVARWARTQSADAYAQLRSGIRYFDLRVLYKPTANRAFCFWLTHGLHETPVQHLIDDVARFLAEYM
jgi:hypothetical protein